jgi:ABC-2 type transport system permease protein
MNIYVFELKLMLKSCIAWTAGILILYLLFLSGMYDALMDSRDAVEKAIAGFPPLLAAAFGVYIGKIFTFGGFYGFIYSYLVLFGAIMAAVLSLGAFSREKRSKCVDFLLTKPLRRESIFTAKLLAVLTLLAAANVLFIAASLVSYGLSCTEVTETGRLVLASCGLFFTQLVFAAIGIAFAVFARKIRSVSGLATAIGFGGFILSALHGLLEKESIRTIAPLKYFDAAHVFETGGYEAKYAVTAVVVTVVCAGLAFYRFCKSDTPAV